MGRSGSTAWVSAAALMLFACTDQNTPPFNASFPVIMGGSNAPMSSGSGGSVAGGAGTGVAGMVARPAGSGAAGAITAPIAGGSGSAGIAGGAGSSGAPAQASAGTGGNNGSAGAAGKAASAGGGTGGGAAPAGGASFATVFSTILSPKCAACHGVPPLDFSSKDQAHKTLVGAETASMCLGMKRVVAGDVEMSVLVHALKADGCRGPTGRMPPSGSPLSMAEIDLVVAWIMAGAKND